MARQGNQRLRAVGDVLRLRRLPSCDARADSPDRWSVQPARPGQASGLDASNSIPALWNLAAPRASAAWLAARVSLRRHGRLRQRLPLFGALAGDPNRPGDHLSAARALDPRPMGWDQELSVVRQRGLDGWGSTQHPGPVPRGPRTGTAVRFCG